MNRHGPETVAYIASAHVTPEDLAAVQAAAGSVRLGKLGPGGGHTKARGPRSSQLYTIEEQEESASLADDDEDCTAAATGAKDASDEATARPNAAPSAPSAPSAPPAPLVAAGARGVPPPRLNVARSKLTHARPGNGTPGRAVGSSSFPSPSDCCSAVGTSSTRTGTTSSTRSSTRSLASSAYTEVPESWRQLAGSDIASDEAEAAKEYTRLVQRTAAQMRASAGQLRLGGAPPKRQRAAPSSRGGGASQRMPLRRNNSGTPPPGSPTTTASPGGTTRTACTTMRSSAMVLTATDAEDCRPAHAGGFADGLTERTGLESYCEPSRRSLSGFSSATSTHRTATHRSAAASNRAAVGPIGGSSVVSAARLTSSRLRSHDGNEAITDTMADAAAIAIDGGVLGVAIGGGTSLSAALFDRYYTASGGAEAKGSPRDADRITDELVAAALAPPKISQVFAALGLPHKAAPHEGLDLAVPAKGPPQPDLRREELLSLPAHMLRGERQSYYQERELSFSWRAPSLSQVPAGPVEVDLERGAGARDEGLHHAGLSRGLCMIGESAEEDRDAADPHVGGGSFAPPQPASSGASAARQRTSKLAGTKLRGGATNAVRNGARR